ncbi:putative ribonuclease H-like domain-containing protein [Tanacetum coccineum]
MDLESIQNNALAKLPLLKQGDYDTWRLRIESYIQLQDYALWEIIEDGNSFKPVARTTTNADGTSTSTIPGAVTAEEKIQKKNDLKARSILMMTLPSEHLLTFNQYKDAKTLFEAIEARFGGNEATKKTQKTLLKQMYENFNASSSESLDSIFTRLQKIVSQLAILGENISQEDLNFKFLRSLPSEWSMHVVVWRNKSDLGSISFDDLYNNFKIVEQEVKRSVTLSSNSSSQNVAFVSTPGSSNEDNTANVQVNTTSTNVSTASSTDNTARLKQIHEDDLEEMDLKWQLALLSLKARKFYQRTGKKIILNGSDTTGYDKSKVECFNCHKIGHFARECRAMLAIDGAGVDWSFMIEEEVPTNFALMAFSDSEIERLKKEKESNQIKIDNFENAYKSLDKLIRSQISDNNRKGVGYNAVSLPPTGLFSPPTINLSNSCLEEFKQPEFEGYGVKVSDCDEDETMEKVSKLANVQKPKQADQPRKLSQNPMNNSTNLNTPMSKKLGKACFVCGSFNHLIKDCDFHDKKMLQKPVLNNVKQGTTVLTKSGPVPISTARQSSSRTTTTVSTARPIKTAAPKPFMNVAKSIPNAFQKSHSPSRRPFYHQTTLNNRNLNNKVNTVKVNSINTANGKRVTSAVGEQGINVVKSKSCWIWRPKLKVLDHVSKNSKSYICKQFDYVDPTGRVKSVMAWVPKRN